METSYHLIPELCSGSRSLIWPRHLASVTPRRLKGTQKSTRQQHLTLNFINRSKNYYYKLGLHGSHFSDFSSICKIPWLFELAQHSLTFPWQEYVLPFLRFSSPSESHRLSLAWLLLLSFSTCIIFPLSKSECRLCYSTIDSNSLLKSNVHSLSLCGNGPLVILQHMKPQSDDNNTHNCAKHKPSTTGTQEEYLVYLPSLHSLATLASSVSIWFCIRFITLSLSRDLRLYAIKIIMMIRIKTPAKRKKDYCHQSYFNLK